MLNVDILNEMNKVNRTVVQHSTQIRTEYSLRSVHSAITTKVIIEHIMTYNCFL